MTVQINMLAPPRHPFVTPPGRPSSDLAGPGRVLQGHFLPTNPWALGNEGRLHGHKRHKTRHSAHQLSAPSPLAQAPAQADVYPAPNAWQG